MLRGTFWHQGKYFIRYAMLGEELADAGSADNFRFSVRAFG